MTIKPHARIFVIQIGGLGDLILISETIARLKQVRPGCHISLMCRAELAPVVDLYPVRPDEVVKLTFNPYGWDHPSEDLFSALEPALLQLKSLKADIFVAASLQPTWFSWFAAAAMDTQAVLCATPATEPVEFLNLVLRRFGLSRRLMHRVEVPPGTHERHRYRLILKNLHVRPKAGFPWLLPGRVEHDARLRLRKLGLQEGRYIVCFPTGSESTKLKRWPEERFLDVLVGVTGERHLPVLLTGEIADEPRLSRIADSIRRHGGQAAVFCGRPVDIPLLGGLVAMASAYLGNDTGPMHLAAAYGVAGVAIYGGGHWPRYAPWEKGSVGMVQPRPCFGCDWDCVFGHGICVEAIESAAVLKAMRDVLSEPPARAEIRAPGSIPPATEDLVRDASVQYRLVQQDRAARLDLILKQTLAAAVLEEQHRAALAGAEARELALAAAMTQAQTARQQFEAEAERRQAKLVELTGMVGERDGYIAELEKALGERLAALERTEAARQQFEAAAEQRQAKLVELTGMVGERDGRIAELEKALGERLAALERAEAARQQFEAAAEQRQAKLVELTGMVRERDRHIADLEMARQQFEAAAEQRQAKLVELTGMVRERDRHIADLEAAGQERLLALERTESARQELHTEIADLQLEFARCRQSLIEELEAEQTSRLAATAELERATAALAEARACCSKMDAELIALRSEKLINFLIRHYKSKSDVPPRA